MFEDLDEEGAERRGAPRVGIEAEVRIHGDAAWAGTYRTGDLSTSGAFLVSESPPPRGSMVRLDIRLDEGTAVRDVQALVVHVRAEASTPAARGCGVMFLRMGKAESEALQSLLAGRVDELEPA